jgi:hypothetical protein
MSKDSSQINSIARKLRVQGKSFRDISKELNQPLSTIHLWTKDIKISREQARYLLARRAEKLQISRERASAVKKKIRDTDEKEIYNLAKTEIYKLKSNEAFLLGLGLYWAEGFKKDHSLGFVNTDLAMLKFFLGWLYEYGMVSKSVIRLRVQINELYMGDINRIEEYWSSQLKIPKEQFQKPYFLKVKQNTDYFDNNYYGLIRIRAIGTRKLFIQINGWIQGLKENIINK